MLEDILDVSNKDRTNSIVALNAVSALAQIGQFGLATALFPIALEAKGATAQTIGIVSAAFWLGMLLGLLIAGKLTRKFGYRNTVMLGLLASALSFICTPFIHWVWWSLPATIIGVGMGLRWIGNETWLYRLAPIEARGRIVGIHETLIAVASILGPFMIVLVGGTKPTAFWFGAAACSVAIAPLFAAMQLPATDNIAHNQVQKNTNWSFWLALGGLIAGFGGWIEGSVIALLPIYAADMHAASQSAWLLTIFGIGTFVFQYTVGWLSDRNGVLWTSKICASVGALALTLTLTFNTQIAILAIALFLLGGVTAGLLTLGMIWAAQHGTGAALTNKVRQVSIVYTCFSAAGPFVAGFVVSQTSSQSLFWQQLVVIFVLFVVLFKAKVTD